MTLKKLHNQTFFILKALKVRPHVLLFSVYDMEISTYILPHLRNTNENVKSNNIKDIVFRDDGFLLDDRPSVQ